MNERPKIKPGFCVGSLTVVSDTGRRKNGYTIWLCACACGGEISLDTRTLQRGTVRDCGCITKVNPMQKNLRGQRFGRLVVLEPTQMRGYNGATVWRCRCDCGNDTLAISTQLTNGNKRSCGCLGHPPLKDFVGKRFGSLTVLEYFGKVSGMHRWKCLCDCGNTTVVGQTLLQSGKTKSCGCLQAQIINENMKFVDGTSVTMLEKSGKRLYRNNTSGYNGVHFNTKTRKWVAQIGFKGRTYYLGSYERIEDAAAAREKNEKIIYGGFLDWYYKTTSSNR